MAEGFSQLDSLEEGMYIVSMYFSAIGLALATIILFSLYGQKSRIKNKKSFQFAIASVMWSICVYLLVLVFDNDLLFAWTFSAKHLSFVSSIDSIENIFFVLGKISFYCSFTYYVLSVFDSNRSKKYLKIWMIVACFLLFCFMIAFLTDDVLEDELKEIGVTPKHNIHLGLLMGHYGAHYSLYFALVIVLIDMAYFVVLLYFYVKRIRAIKKRQNNGNEIKGVVLLVMACLIFWFFAIMIVMGSSLKWVMAPIDIISDDICLFLMFEQQTKLYQSLCKRCDVCCFKCVFGSKGYAAVSNGDDSQENEDQNEI